MRHAVVFLAAGLVLLAAGAASGGDSRLFTRCSVASGAAASARSTTGPVSFNYPYAGGPTAAYADAGTQTARALARAERQAANDDCTAEAVFTRRLVVAAGSSGLAKGTPVTLRLTMSLQGTADEVGLGGDAPFLAWLNMYGEYSAKDETGDDVAFLSFQLQRITDASGATPADPDGSLTHRLTWGWQLSSNAAAEQSDSGSVDEMLCQAWPCQVTVAPFAVPVGSRTIDLKTTIGAKLDVRGKVNTLAQASTGPSRTTGDFLDGLHAELAGAPGFEGVELADEQAELAVENLQQDEGNEGEAPLVLRIVRSGPLDRESTVHYATADGTAVAGDDYRSASGTATFAPLEEFAEVPISVIGDTSPEPDETVELRLSDPAGAEIVDAVGTGTILNDDSGSPPPPPPPPPAGACILVEPDTPVDFGTAGFSTSGSPETKTGTPAITVSSCTDAAETVSVHATAATGGSATWTLSDQAADPCALGANMFALALDQLLLSATDKAWVHLAARASMTATARLTTPCSGSSGSGETMAARIVFTATSD
jgi:hypothetical protein